MGPPRRVVKVGGSLTELPMYHQQVSQWLAAQPRAATVVITGGGAWADAVRELDARRPLPPPVAHELAIRAMSLTAWILHQYLEDWGFAADWRHAQAALERAEQGTLILDVATFLRREEPNSGGSVLPVGWEVTSDSIAARIANLLSADELVLLKSCATPLGAPTHPSEAHSQLERLAINQYVDHHFPRAAQGLRRIRFVNLRQPTETAVLELT